MKSPSQPTPMKEIYLNRDHIRWVTPGYVTKVCILGDTEELSVLETVDEIEEMSHDIERVSLVRGKYERAQ